MIRILCRIRKAFTNEPEFTLDEVRLNTKHRQQQ